MSHASMSIGSPQESSETLLVPKSRQHTSNITKISASKNLAISQLEGFSRPPDPSTVYDLIEAQTLTGEEQHRIASAKLDWEDSETSDLARAWCQNPDELEVEIITQKWKTILTEGDYFSGDWDEREWAALKLAIKAATKLSQSEGADGTSLSLRCASVEITSNPSLLHLGTQQVFCEVLDGLSNALKKRKENSTRWGAPYLDSLQVSREIALLPDSSVKHFRTVWALRIPRTKATVLQDPTRTQEIKDDAANTRRIKKEKKQAAISKNTLNYTSPMGDKGSQSC